jgi:signal transduction histidine kinase/ActR/RegA family two-component response regulator
MRALIWDFLSTEGFQPHGMCLLWRADLFWTHLVSDALIAASYFSIPLAIVYLAARRPDLRFSWMLYLFGAFIIACGVTHLFGIWTMFVPDYGVEAIVKVATASVSVATAVMLWPLMPAALAAPSPAQLEARNADLAREIAERRAAEARLAQLNDELERRVAERTATLAAANRALVEARAVAERSNRAKSEFLATMSHEIRTPMNGVLGVLDLLAMGELRPDQAKLVAMGRESGASLLALIGDILDHSRLEAGAVELEARAFDPRRVASQAMALVAGAAARKGLALELDAAEDLAAELTGDPTRLGQVLTNLVGNAVKFTARGSVRIGLAQAPLPGGRVELRIEVRDTGVGIPPEAAGRLFERFSQADSSTSRRFGGAGLGLAISKQLVELMGGAIGVDSAPGHGSRFWFTVVCDPAAAPAAPRDAVAAEPAETAGPTGPLRVLVAEDNAVNQFLVTTLLRNRGHEVEVASDGAEAIAAVERSRYDLVLMDISMPGVDGVTATRRIRGMAPRLARIPIIALTAHAMAGDRESFLAAGMTDYVVKPVDPRTLFAAIARAVAGGRGGGVAAT